MNQLVIIIIAAVGILLIYAAVKNERPQDIVMRAFGQERKA
jgi:hypothetical protein